MEQYIVLMGQKIQYCCEVNYPPNYQQIPNKIPACFLKEIGKLILKCIWEWKEPKPAKTTLKKNSKERI